MYPSYSFPTYADDLFDNSFDPVSKNPNDYTLDFPEMISDLYTSSSSQTSSPRSAVSDSLASTDDSHSLASVNSYTIDPMMFHNDDLFAESISLPAKRRSWTSFKNSLPENIAASEPVTPKRKRSSVYFPNTFLFPNHSVPPRRTRRDSIASITSRDAEGESDDGASDEEYLPSPSSSSPPSDLKPRRVKSKHRRHAPYNRPTKSTKSLPVTPARGPSKRPRISPPSRNTQSSDTKAMRLKEVVDTNALEKIDFTCPECGWKQVNRRIPDFKRHLKTHLRTSENSHYNGYWCKGIRVQDMSEYPIAPDAVPYAFKNEQRIGGCMHTFSRRDALKRHLDNPNIACVFDSLQE